MSNRLFRVLLVIMGVLSIILSLRYLSAIWVDGLTIEGAFMCVFAALMACVCLWAAAGAGGLSSENN